MATNFDIIQRDVAGKTGRYCRIKRLTDNWWWDNINKHFVENQSVDSDIAMIEDNDEPGRYFGSTYEVFANGVYEVNLYSTDGAQIISSQRAYKVFDKTLLEIINDIRRRLRFEQVTDLTDPFSLLLIDFANNIQQDYMTDETVWAEMRMVTIATTIIGQQLYTLNPPNIGTFDFMHRIYEFPGGFELRPFGDSPSQGALDKGKPLYWNIQFQGSEIPTIFISPAPITEQPYLIVYYSKPATMVNAEDIPELNSDAIILGAYAMALESQGNSPDMAFQIFNNKVERLAENVANIWMDDDELTPT